jgi:hypothetical protein
MEEDKASVWWAKLWLRLLDLKARLGLGLMGSKMENAPSPFF